MPASWLPGSHSSRCSPAGRLSGPPSPRRVPLLSLVAYGAGGLLAAAVHPGQLGAGSVGYLAALVGVVAIAGLALIRGSSPV